ncbi:MAG: HD domain-containing protein [Rhodocyclaceae bacterium]|nr:HD domain-containing protein [Rhodocyclaceae bacterium]
MKIDPHRAICALTTVLDFVGIDELQHGKRVAWISESIAREIGWDEDRQAFLFYAGMLHDCGVSKALEHRRLTDGLTWNGAEGHCLRGESYLLECAPLRCFASVVRWHHTPWQQIQQLGIPAELALQSNLLFLADRVDALQAPHLNVSQVDDAILAARDRLVDTVRAHSGSLFNPDLVATFERIARRESFWLAMDPAYLLEYLENYPFASPLRDLSDRDVLALARLFARVVDAKSPFTHEHSLRVAKVARRLYELFELPGEGAGSFEVAALLHDIGKLRVPDEILEKPGPLSRAERAVISRHSYDTYRILNRVFPESPIPRWASSHHENLLGTGYPFHRAAGDIDLETRILVVADVLQALSQDRPYRGRLGSQAVGMQLVQMRDEGRVDGSVVSAALLNLEELYHLATQG